MIQNEHDRFSTSFISPVLYPGSQSVSDNCPVLHSNTFRISSSVIQTLRETCFTKESSTFLAEIHLALIWYKMSRLCSIIGRWCPQGVPGGQEAGTQEHGNTDVSPAGSAQLACWRPKGACLRSDTDFHSVSFPSSDFQT